jgi:DNA polymerase-3 subunit beta
MTGSEGPCGITGDDDSDYLVIIMPMQIVEETYYSEEASA